MPRLHGEGPDLYEISESDDDADHASTKKTKPTESKSKKRNRPARSSSAPAKRFNRTLEASRTASESIDRGGPCPSPVLSPLLQIDSQSNRNEQSLLPREQRPAQFITSQQGPQTAEDENISDTSSSDESLSRGSVPNAHHMSRIFDGEVRWKHRVIAVDKREIQVGPNGPHVHYKDYVKKTHVRHNSEVERLSVQFLRFYNFTWFPSPKYLDTEEHALFRKRFDVLCEIIGYNDAAIGKEFRDSLKTTLKNLLGVTLGKKLRDKGAIIKRAGTGSGYSQFASYTRYWLDARWAGSPWVKDEANEQGESQMDEGSETPSATSARLLSYICSLHGIDPAAASTVFNQVSTQQADGLNGD